MGGMNSNSSKTEKPPNNLSEWLNEPFSASCRECGTKAAIVYWYRPILTIENSSMWEYMEHAYYCDTCAAELDILPPQEEINDDRGEDTTQ